MKSIFLAFTLLLSVPSLASTTVSCFTKFYFTELFLTFDFEINESNEVQMISGSVEGEALELNQELQSAHVLSNRSSHPGYLEYKMGIDKNQFDGWMGLSVRIPADYLKNEKSYKAYVLAKDSQGASLHQVICKNK